MNKTLAKIDNLIMGQSMKDEVKKIFLEYADKKPVTADKNKYSVMGNNKLIIAIDFDNTIVEPLYPEIGVLKANCKRIINKWHESGHKIIINTCRAGKYHGDCDKFLSQNGISFDYINCNLPEMIIFYKADTRKISADVYIDDRNIGGIPDWLGIEKMMDNLFLEYVE